MNFCHVTLTVKDLDASIRFYTEVAGLPVHRRYPAGPGTEIAFLGNGETKIELIHQKDRPDAVIGNGVSIGFEVESAPEKLKSLQAAGVPVIGDMIQPNPHVRFFYAADPDGFREQFIENL